MAEARALGLALMALLAGSGPAAAHWEYTRWGMTEARVIAASRGAVRALPPAARRQAGELEYRAAGTHVAEGISFRVFFGFAGGGLRCVSILGGGPQQAPALRQWITARFGPPQAVGGDARESVLSWSTPDDIEMMVQDGVVVALHCAG